MVTQYLYEDGGLRGASTTAEQSTLLVRLNDTLSHFRALVSQRDEALTRLDALEQEVDILRTLAPSTCATGCAGMVKYREPAAFAAGGDGLFNRGYRDRTLRWLADALEYHADPELRRWAATALGIMSDSRSVPALSSALNDADEVVRREAAMALGKIGTAQVVVPLSAALRDSNRQVRTKAVKALGKTGKPAVELLIGGLRDTNVLARHASSDALASIGGPAVPALTKALLQENDRLLRTGAVETLSKMREPRAVASLVLALMDPDREIQDMAARALVKTGRPAIHPLVRVLKVARGPFRRRVAQVLIRTRGLAVKPLVEALGDDNADVRLAASEALVKIGTPALRPLVRALRSPKPALRLEAAMALGLTGAPRAVTPLVQAMKGRDRDLQQSAAKALVRIGKPATPALVSLFKETDLSVRQRASQALLQIGRPAFEPLCQALHDADYGTRCEAARVLSSLRSSGILRGLHGEWERIADDTLLLAWFNSGWAQRGTDGARPYHSPRGCSSTSTTVRRLPKRGQRESDQPGDVP